MAQLPPRPDLDHLRHQAKDLLHAAQRGEMAALDRLTLASAQHAVAHDYGFAG